MLPTNPRNRITSPGPVYQPGFLAMAAILRNPFLACLEESDDPGIGEHTPSAPKR